MVFNNAVDANTSGFQSITSAGVWNGRTLIAGSGISITNGDGTAGNPTISSTGSVDPSTTSTLFDDFLNFGNVDQDIPLICWSLSGNSSYNPTSSGEASHPGIVLLNSTTSDQTLRGNTATNAPYVLGGGTFSVSWLVKITTLSNGTDDYTLSIGLANNVFNINTAALYFSYRHSVNSGNWTITNRQASTNTTANTSTAAGTNWTKFTITVNAAATSVDYLINDVAVANSPLTTNIPVSPNQIGPFVYVTRNAGTTSRTFKLDYCLVNYTGLTR